jgi:hypothetical protein
MITSAIRKQGPLEPQADAMILHSSYMPLHANAITINVTGLSLIQLTEMILHDSKFCKGITMIT